MVERKASLTLGSEREASFALGADVRALELGRSAALHRFGWLGAPALLPGRRPPLAAAASGRHARGGLPVTATVALQLGRAVLGRPGVGLGGRLIVNTLGAQRTWGRLFAHR